MKVVEVTIDGGAVYVTNQMTMVPTYVGLETDLKLLDFEEKHIAVDTMAFLQQGVTPKELIEMRKVGLV